MKNIQVGDEIKIKDDTYEITAIHIHSMSNLQTVQIEALANEDWKIVGQNENEIDNREGSVRNPHLDHGKWKFVSQGPNAGKVECPCGHYASDWRPHEEEEPKGQPIEYNSPPQYTYKGIPIVSAEWMPKGKVLFINKEDVEVIDLEELKAYET